MSHYSPVREQLNERMNNFMTDTNNQRKNREGSGQRETRENLNSQVQKLQLEADIYQEGGNISDYIFTLEKIYQKIKNERGFNKLQYEIATQLQKYGSYEKSLLILLALYEVTSNSDSQTMKARDIAQYSDKALGDIKLGQTSFLITLCIDIGNGYFSSGEFEKALEYYSQALKDLQANDECQLSCGQLYLNKGLCCLYLQDYSVAERYFRKVIKTLVERMQDPRKDKLLVISYKKIAFIQEMCNEPNKALMFYVKALKVGLNAYQPDNLEIIDLHYHICRCFFKLNKLKEGINRLEKVIYMINSRHESFKQESPVYLSRLGDYYALLGNLYFTQRQFDFAQRCFESSLKVWKEFGIQEADLKCQKSLEFLKICNSYLMQDPNKTE
ncbi:unnamed protein product [Moneuplotes crassus]|uniref:Tetratricopeptide repeat protein n=1 Tax=Euplotes crassus TaxID=5936 RepID=A0AAD1XH15_EUPCR|nr:unnamed protein product [Moneuplotes crassus]